ncbi:hypothetical protein Tco_0254831 [Tanacetum coccineum]
MTKKNFKKLDPLMHLEYLRYSFRRSSIHDPLLMMTMYDRRVKETQIQMQEGEVDKDNTLDADSVVTKSSETKSKKHVTSSRSGNDTHAEDVNIKPVNDKELVAEVQLTTKHNVLANEQQHTEQS